MHPILVKLGPVTIYSYGVMVAIAFSVIAVLAYRRAPKFGIDQGKVIDYIILLLVSGILGARALYVLLNFRYYSVYPLEILNLSKGGLVWYGGFCASLLASIWFVKRNKIDFWHAADFFSPYLALGQAFGRIGCYLNGCCYGIIAPPNFFLGERHPTQIYSAVLLFMIFVVLMKWQERKHFKGEIFLGYCILYSLKRFFIEFLRADNPKIFHGLTMSQLVSVVVLLTALFIFKIRADKWKRELSK